MDPRWTSYHNILDRVKNGWLNEALEMHSEEIMLTINRIAYDSHYGVPTLRPAVNVVREVLRGLQLIEIQAREDFGDPYGGGSTRQSTTSQPKGTQDTLQAAPGGEHDRGHAATQEPV